MPELCRFQGIVITMYAEAGEKHNTPHFHVRYADGHATFSIATGDLMQGSIPKPQLRLVQAWVELHRSELEEAWKLLLAGRNPQKIAPLS